jgi:indolepyruvate ferredoxin oxidoreductase, beta subunit
VPSLAKESFRRNIVTFKQQIIIGGIGGQGVLFVTRLLAEAAMRNNLSVLTSETHGMAQRGGNVVSHLKIGNYHGPMIQPGHADGLIALKGETGDQFIPQLKQGAWGTVNEADGQKRDQDSRIRCLDADAIAMKSGFPRSVNIVMLGFTLAVIETPSADQRFCTLDDIKAVMTLRLKEKPGLLKSSLSAIDAGYTAGGIFK